MDIKIILACVVAALIFILMLYFVIKKLMKKKSEAPKIFIERQNSGNTYQILDDDFPIPKDGFNYGMSFFIYINDYTYNSGYWKHLMHKGNELNTTYPLKFKNWDELSSVVDLQSPGIWMHPNGTKLRLCFSVKVTKNICGLNLSENECDSSYCKWDGNQCKNNDEHALKMGESKNLDYSRDEIILEYIDLDIPFKKVHHIAFSLENKILNIYTNGKIAFIHKFFGEPMLNMENLYFNYPLTFDGTIFNFSYFPLSISSKKVEKLSKQKYTFSLE